MAKNTIDAGVTDATFLPCEALVSSTFLSDEMKHQEILYFSEGVRLLNLFIAKFRVIHILI